MREEDAIRRLLEVRMGGLFPFCLLCVKRWRDEHLHLRVSDI